MIYPFLNSFCFSADSYKNVLARVVALLFGGSPSAVFRAVVPVVVYSVKGVFCGRSRTHVSEKHFKAMKPSIAHCNTPAKVVMTASIAGFCASLNKTLPRLVFRCFRHFVRGVASGTKLLGETTTGYNGAFPKVICSDDLDVATVTKALPVCAIASTGRLSKHNEAGVSIANFIFQCSHNILRQMLLRVSVCGTRHGKRFSVANLATDKVYHRKAG